MVQLRIVFSRATDGPMERSRWRGDRFSSADQKRHLCNDYNFINTGRRHRSLLRTEALVCAVQDTSPLSAADVSL